MATRPERQKISEQVEYWNILLSGDPGVGKTVFCGSDNGVLFICTEDVGRNSGTISAARMGSNAEKIPVHHWLDVKNAYEWWEDHPEELKDVKVLAIDSLPEMQRLAREYVLEVTADEKRRKGHDPELMQLQDYGMMHEIVENMVRGLNDLPVNVLYTSTAKKVDDADKKEFLAPDIQGKGDYGFAMKIAALMTSYGYMRIEVLDDPAPTAEDPNATVKVRHRVFYWEDNGTIKAKDRTCSLAPFTIDMTLQKMRLAIDGKMIRNEQGLIVKKDAATQQQKKAVATAPVKTPVAQPSPEASQDKPSEVKSEDTLASDAKAPAPEEKTEAKEESQEPELELDAVQA